MTTASEVGEFVVIEVPSEDGRNPNRKLTGTIQGLRGNSLIFVTTAQISLSTPARVQSKDFLMIGRVSACLPGPQGGWAISLDVTRKILVI